ncbi:hypothetical protein EJ110_NYTH54788 [Nymphaea thermarum]|nr:hypothetical protein EJ110_NYTH54788 [Nymphaea thermarum]
MLRRRKVCHDGGIWHEYLVEWDGQEGGPTWEEANSLAEIFPMVGAWGQAPSKGGGSVAALPSAACQAIASDPDGAAEGTSHAQGEANSSASHSRDSAPQGTMEERAISVKGGYESTLGQRGRPPPGPARATTPQASAGLADAQALDPARAATREDLASTGQCRRQCVDIDLRQFTSEIAQILATERTTQGPNTRKGKGLLGMPDYQTVTEVNPNNISQVGTSTDGAKLMGPPPDRQPEPYSEYYRAPHEPKGSGHVSQDFAYELSEGEDETPLRPRRTQRHILRQEERRTPTVKYDFPKFNGEGLCEWLFMAERYFVLHRIPRDEWIETAAANTTGEATTHYLWFDHKTRDPTWEKFKASFQLRFGESTFIDYDEDLKKLVQTTTVPAYHKQFIRLASQVLWTERALIGAFKGGLKKEVLLEMQVQNYDTLEECFAMARICEVRLEEKRALKRTHKIEKQKKQTSHSSSSRHKSNELVPYNNRREFQHNSRCEGKWDKTHQCTALNCIVVIVEPDPEDSPCSGNDSSPSSSSSSSSEEEVIVKKKYKKSKKSEAKNEEASTSQERLGENESLHSMQDPHKPNSMRVFGRINGHKVLILLDNGATNNFFTEEAAKRCNVALQPGKPQTIIVGGGYRLKCLEEGKDMEVIINKMTFKIDSLVIPLEGVDLVLGMTWFLQWRDIHWQVKNFKMTFIPEDEGEPLTLQSLVSNVHPKAALRAIAAEQPACWGRMRHEVLVEWEGPDRGTSWEEFGSVVHYFPTTNARGQAQGREGESVTDQTPGPDPVGTEHVESSRRKRKASDLWARSLHCAEVSPKKVETAPTSVAVGGAGLAAGSDTVLELGKSQGDLGSNVGLTELEESNPSGSGASHPLASPLACGASTSIEDLHFRRCHSGEDQVEGLQRISLLPAVILPSSTVLTPFRVAFPQVRCLLLGHGEVERPALRLGRLKPAIGFNKRWQRLVY